MTTAVAEQIYGAAFNEGLRPLPLMTVSEWADRYRIIPKDGGAKEPGKWRTSRFPFTKEIMDNLSPFIPVRETVLVKGTQIAGTEMGNNWIAYSIHMNPTTIMDLLPTIDVAKRHSKTKIKNTIEQTPEIKWMDPETKRQRRVADPRERDSGNTTLMKEFPGGSLIIAGANSAKSLRNISIQNLILDEVDAYEQDLESEGDTVTIAKKRTDSFGDEKKIFILSTPTTRGISKIEKEFQDSDQRHYYVPCPFCRHKQYLRWKDGEWNGPGAFRIIFAHDEHYNLIGDVKYCCENCGELIDEHHKTWMFENGEWVPHNPGNERRGYKLPSFYSPLGFLSWMDIVKEFLKAKREADIEQLKVWVMTRLAEAWDDSIQPLINTASLLAKCEQYGPIVPLPALALTCQVDTQDNRLEVQLDAHGLQEESWVMDYKVIDGNPAHSQVWTDLEEYINAPWKHASGALMKISITLIDSGGHFSQQVYDFVSKMRRKGKRCYSTKGSQFPGKPIFERAGRKKGNKSSRLDYFIGTDTAKDTVLYRLFNIMRPITEAETFKSLSDQPVELNPYRMHFREGICDEEYFAQLTAEKPTKKKFKRVYEQIRERNEALDLSVLKIAAIRILRPNWKRIIEKLAKSAEKNKSGEAGKQEGGEVRKYKLEGKRESAEESRGDPAGRPETEEELQEEIKQTKPRTGFVRRTVGSRRPGGWVNNWR